MAGKREKVAAAAVEAERGLARAQQRAALDHAAADNRARQDHAAHEAAVDAAQQITTDAEQALAAGGAAATAAARTWAHHVAVWQSSLVHLDPAAVVLPDDLDTVDLHQQARAVQQAHATITARLQRSIAAAEHDRDQAQQTVDGLEAELRPPAGSRRYRGTAVAWRAAPGRRSPVLGGGRVRPTDSDHADRLEGALLVSGLLDAVITHDGRLVGDGDLTLSPHQPVPGRNLADLLTAEPDGGIDPHRITTLLRSITIDDHNGDTNAGRLRVGPLIATAPRDYRAAFIGRTARERARLDRVTDLEHQLATATATLAGAQQHRIASPGHTSRPDRGRQLPGGRRHHPRPRHPGPATPRARRRPAAHHQSRRRGRRRPGQGAGRRRRYPRQYRPQLLDARQRLASAGDALQDALEAETAATENLDAMRAELVTAVDHRDRPKPPKTGVPAKKAPSPTSPTCDTPCGTRTPRNRPPSRPEPASPTTNACTAKPAPASCRRSRPSTPRPRNRTAPCCPSALNR